MYLFSMARGVGVIDGCAGITTGMWVIDGAVEGVAWGWDELGEAKIIIERFDVPTEVSLDWMEFYKFLSRCEVTTSSCKFSMNKGSWTVWANPTLEKFTNKEVSNHSSKGSSSW